MKEQQNSITHEDTSTRYNTGKCSRKQEIVKTI